MAKSGSNKPFGKAWLLLIKPIAVVITLCALSATPAHGAPSGPELRAAVIVAILRFTSWQSVIPQSEVSEVRLCAVGQPRSAPYLRQVSGVQKVAGHVLIVDDLPDFDISDRQCNALVIGPQPLGSDFARMLAQADTQSLLTICDGCRGVNAADTIIQLELHKQRVKFEVNLVKARASGVMLDAQLLELAAVVRQ